MPDGHIRKHPLVVMWVVIGGGRELRSLSGGELVIWGWREKDFLGRSFGGKI